ncbi:unnamed protein product [Bathycoccus prasinos]
MKTMSFAFAKPLSASATSAPSKNRTRASVALVKAPQLNRKTSSIVSLNGAARRTSSTRRRVKAFAHAVVVRASSTDESSFLFEKDIDPAKLLMERQQFLFVDMRSAKMYENEHIVKPPRQTVNVPYGEEETIETFTSKLKNKYINPSSAKLLLACADGTIACKVAEKMQKEFGYEEVFGVKGGYDGWMVKWTPSGRKRPPKGKFVATGRESLKSGLDLDPEVAATYEENWGNPEASFAANSNLLKKDD